MLTNQYYMFIHGLGLSGSIWSLIKPLFEDEIVVTPDLPGHGKGPRSSNKYDYGFPAMWSYLNGIISDVNISDTILVLHSMSAGLLPEIASSTNKPKAIVLVEGNLLETDALWSKQIQALKNNEYYNWLKRLKNNASTVLKSQLLGSHTRNKINYWSDGFREVDPFALRAIASDIAVRTSTGEILRALATLDVPIIFIRGSESGPWDGGIRLLKELDIPLVIIPVASHYPMIDHPKAVWSAIMNVN
jgi:pimeloyl-ACP methyl ester carboxylesterase